MRTNKYILDENNNPVPVEDVLEWATWFQTSKQRRVAHDITTALGDVDSKKVIVSTVFLGLDHSWGEGPPVLWETMIFGGEHDEYQMQYTSLEAAKEGHKAALALVQKPGRKFKEI